MGPLQSVIDQVEVRMAKGEAMKEKNEGIVASLQVLDVAHVLRRTACLKSCRGRCDIEHFFRE